MNKRGQALVEFVIILPIFIFMLLSIMDIGRIIYFQNEMVSELSDVVSLYRNSYSYDDIKDELSLEDKAVSLEIKNDNNETITFYLKKTTDVVTPGLGVILGNPHTITVERTIAYE